MDKMTECKIIQDLLLGYVDETLNEETKKIVEDHLSKCEFCRRKLQEIKEEMIKDGQNEQKEIDYLKKIRIKSRIKAIVLAIIIVLVIIFTFYLTKFIKINSVMHKGVQYAESQNYYVERVGLIGSSTSTSRKTYYKDGKYKVIDEYYTDDGCNYRVIRYGEVGSDKVIEFDEINKIVYIKTGKFTTLANKKENVHFVDTISTQERTSFSANWYKTFNTELHSDTIGSNKPYYVLSKTNGEYWIDKETGLVIRDIERQVDYDYYLEEGNRALKSINDRITIYEYKFDTVTDEDLEVPDYTGYMVEERTE